MNYQITKITEHHIDGYAQAFDSVARELRYLAYFEGLSRETTVEYVRQNIAENWPHFVALDGEKVVGWCDISSLDRPVFEHAGGLSLGIIREYRDKGVGKKLLTVALQAAKGRGLSRVELTVRERNPVAIKLYERAGFVKEGLHIKAVKINGKYENHFSMALLIPENE